jgi:intein/homing endonuclease
MDKFIFEDIKESWQAYFLGFLFSDGYIGNREVAIKLCYLDEQILIDLKNKLGCGAISKRKGNLVKHINGVYLSKDYSILRIYNVKMIKELEKFGMTKNKTFTIQLPTNINYFNHFLRGYFDGDGCLTFSKTGDKKYPKIKIASNDLFIKQLLDYLKIGSISKQGRISVLTITKRKDIEYFAALIYKDCDICLERKKNKFIEYDLINESYN